MSLEDVVEGLNTYRAVEACGERVLRAWADTEPEEEARRGFTTIAEREGNHAGALAQRVAVLGGQAGPSCVDEALSSFIEQALSTEGARARLDLFNALVNGKGETAEALAACMRGIRIAFDEGDAETRAMLESIFVDEKLSIDWCAAYGREVSRASGARAG